MLEIIRDMESVPSRCRYPWADLGVGDGFEVSGKQDFVRAVTASGAWGKRHGRKFRTSWNRVTGIGSIRRET